LDGAGICFVDDANQTGMKQAGLLPDCAYRDLAKPSEVRNSQKHWLTDVILTGKEVLHALVRRRSPWIDGGLRRNDSGMTKTVDRLDAKRDLDSLVDLVKTGNDVLLVERDGTRSAALIPAQSFDELETYRRLAAQESALNSLRELRELRAETLALNDPITEEEAIAIGDEMIREALASMVAKGLVKFEGE